MNAAAAIALAYMSSWFLTVVLRRFAVHTGLMDVPNARSSHEKPTPRGGGIAIVVTICLMTVVLFVVGQINWRAVAIVCGPGAIVAITGYLDDRRGASVRLRFIVHILAAMGTVIVIWPVSGPVNESAWLLTMTWLVVVISVGWMINLFNFMDGIDGFAASEAVFIFGTAALLVWVTDERSHWPTLLAVGAAATAGFLWWNWAPAQIFMGDVGSGFLGFLIAGFALLTSSEGVLGLPTWIILVSLFIADATVTLIRRMIHREVWYAPHRTHAYQRLARSTLGHAGVTWASWLWNLLVIAPVAYWSVVNPELAMLLATATMFVSVALVLFLGGGRRE